jgi:twitching motility protein PilT
MQEVKEFVQPLAGQLGSLNEGIEYHQKIGEIIERLPDPTRVEMRNIIDNYLLMMKQNDASDIDLGGPGCKGTIWYRIHGLKSPVKSDRTLSMVETDFLLHNLLVPTQRKTLYKEKNLDFSYSVSIEDGKNQRYRADLYFDMHHLALNMRKIDNEIRPFKTLDLHTEVAKKLSLKHQKFGLTLITGITGSGKSTTLDTIIDANNRTVDAHIVIIASPVELVHTPVRSVVRHREVGRDVPDFKEGAIQALRQDPDIIVIGELRDPETIMTALEVTDSGHKTFGTLHTSSAVESIERILGEVPPNEQVRIRNRLADVLQCVISQKLIPTLDGERVLAKEVLMVTSSVRAAIRNNNISEIYQMLMEGSEKGMNTMEQDLKNLYELGRISKEEAENNANNKKRFAQLLSKNVH